MRTTIILASVIGICWTMTTHMPKPTHEPHETQMVSYFYNHKTQSLIIKVFDRRNVICYVAALTDQDKLDVHTDMGLRALELRLLGQLSTASPAKKFDLQFSDQHYCGDVRNNGTLTYFTL